MGEVARKLQTIYEQVQTKPTKRRRSSTSGMVGEALVAAAQAFASRVGNEEDRTKLGELSKEVESTLGKEAIGALTGVYNPARLYRFLLGNRMDVQDAKLAVVLNSNSRAELEMDAKRDAICKL